ncbi:hypothetical protein EDD16DRAFT_1567313 [Pisolithus croceorrhizus]|nr:hypothetical protein EDD16DRAFT_1567313 [Pisolithus croceorrhizus]
MQVWENRLEFADLKRKFPSLSTKEDEELLHDKERVVKKPKVEPAGPQDSCKRQQCSVISGCSGSRYPPKAKTCSDQCRHGARSRETQRKRPWLQGRRGECLPTALIAILTALLEVRVIVISCYTFAIPG